MSNQYSRLTADNIRRKMNRKRNPVSSIAGLAREFGVETKYYRYTDGQGTLGSAAPGAFRKKVKALVGEEDYNRLREDRFVNSAYR